jgi:hypothetical protein
MTELWVSLFIRALPSSSVLMRDAWADVTGEDGRMIAGQALDILLAAEPKVS